MSDPFFTAAVFQFQSKSGMQGDRFILEKLGPAQVIKAQGPNCFDQKYYRKLEKDQLINLMQSNMSYGYYAPKFFSTKDNIDSLALGRVEASCEL